MTKYIDYTGVREEKRKGGERGHMSGWISREGKEGGKNTMQVSTCRSLPVVLSPNISCFPFFFFFKLVSPSFTLLSCFLNIFSENIKKRKLLCTSLRACIHACVCVSVHVCVSLVRRDLARLPRANELHLNPAPLILPSRPVSLPQGPFPALP